jgi:hypothetical protein
MLQNKDWITHDKTANLPVPFPSDKEYLKQLQACPIPNTETEKHELEQRMGLKYRQVMGEIMFPMVKCRPDTSSYAIILSQYMDNPGEAHYHALKEITKYLAATRDHGIYYWREKPRMDLPTAELTQTHADNYTIKENRGTNSNQLIAFVDSDWATNTRKRNSITGMILMYAGGAVGYKTKFQPVIAHSSTEAEFIAACDTAKMILFFRSILEELGIPQQAATILFEDNTGALLIANAQQPTHRTRHIEIKHFALLDWVEQDMVTLHSISTRDNAADAMTKTLTRQLFYRHRDTYMGYRIPEYVRSTDGHTLHARTTLLPHNVADS